MARMAAGDWVTETTSVGQGEVVKVEVNGSGKEIILYRMPTGQTARQFAEFLTLGTRPPEAVAATD